MRIAIFHNVPGGGAKRAIYEWTRRLAAIHTLEVYSLSTADHDYCDIRPFAAKHRIFEFVPRRLFNSPFGRLNQLQRWRDLGEMMRIGAEIAREIDSGDYNVVFANTCTVSFIPSFLCYVKTPSVYYLHEPFGVGFARQFHHNSLAQGKIREALNQYDPLIKLYRRCLSNLQHISLSRTTELLANSHFTRACMQTGFNVEAAVCRLGVDNDRFRPMPGIGKGDHVISVGELSPRKGFDFLVRSLGLIPPKERPDLTLACNFVDKAEEHYVMSLAADFAVNVRVLRNLTTDQLAIEYNKARLCIYAPVMEPFGLVPLEAMACGTPVVGVREGGVEESVLHQQTGLLVERDPAKFAAAVRSLLSNEALLVEYGRLSRQHVMCHWTWSESAKMLERHLMACARNQSTGGDYHASSYPDEVTTGIPNLMQMDYTEYK